MSNLPCQNLTMNDNLIPGIEAAWWRDEPGDRNQIWNLSIHQGEHP